MQVERNTYVMTLDTRVRFLVVLPLSILATLIGLTVGHVTYLEMEVRYWDRRIEQLCANEGGRNVGIRIYERVTAPDSIIEGPSLGLPGQVRVPFESKHLNADAPFVQRYADLEILNQSVPKVAKFSVQIVRRSDQKILGEEIRYLRSGGGMPMPDPSDSYTCPPVAITQLKTRALFSKVFINHPIQE